jgi:hypothetical protein
MPNGQGRPGDLFQVQDRAQRHIDLHKLAVAETPCELAQALGVNGGRLLHEDSHLLPQELDRRVDHGAEGLSRSRGHQPCGQVLVSVGLDHYGISLTTLLMPLRGAWVLQPIDVTMH